MQGKEEHEKWMWESLFCRRWLKPLREIRFSRGVAETKKTLLRVRPWELAVFEVQIKEAESLKKTRMACLWWWHSG